MGEELPLTPYPLPPGAATSLLALAGRIDVLVAQACLAARVARRHGVGRAPLRDPPRRGMMSGVMSGVLHESLGERVSCAKW